MVQNEAVSVVQRSALTGYAQILWARCQGQYHMDLDLPLV